MKKEPEKIALFSIFFNILNSVCCIPLRIVQLHADFEVRMATSLPHSLPSFSCSCGPELPKEDDFLKCSFQQTHLIFHLHFTNGKWYQVDFFCRFFLSFGPLNLMLCILDCCYWWKHQTLVEYSSFPNKRVGWSKRNGGKNCSCLNIKKACLYENF